MRSHAVLKCRGCRKNPKVCLCDRIVPRELAHRVIVYQHPVEVWRASNTALLITMLYPSARIIIRGDPEGEALLDLLLAEPGCKPYVVFPEPGATEAGDLARTGWAPGERPLFIMIDGSWRQARRMRRRLMQAKVMPAVRLNPARESGYRVRRQIRAGNLATAEATALLIGRLDGREGADPALQDLFDEWIDEILVVRGMMRADAKPPARALLPMPPRAANAPGLVETDFDDEAELPFED
jgi:DTW domain-containing protein YfiP